MDEVPHRVVIHLETTLGQLGHQSAQAEGFLPDPVHKPGVVLAPDCLRLVPAHLPRRHTPGLPEAPNPGDRRVDPNAEPRRRRAPRQTLLLNCCNHTLTKINRIRLCQPCWPPSPASMLNQIRPTRGIPNRIGLMSSRSRPGGSGRTRLRPGGQMPRGERGELNPNRRLDLDAGPMPDETRRH